MRTVKYHQKKQDITERVSTTLSLWTAKYFSYERLGSEAISTFQEICMALILIGEGVYSQPRHDGHFNSVTINALLTSD